MNRMKRFCILFLLLVLPVVLSSCICHTSASMLESSVFHPARQDAAITPRIYRVGGQYYLAHTIRYECREDKVLVGGMAAVHGSEVYLPFGYERETREKTLYFRLSRLDARVYLNAVVPEPAADEPAVICGEDWDAAAAEAVPARKVVLDVWEASRESSCLYDVSTNTFRLGVPSLYAGDVAVKAPLALVLLAVDIPVSAVATVGTVTGIFPALAYAFDWIVSLGQTKSETQN